MNSAIRSVIALKLSDFARTLDAQKRFRDADSVETMMRRLSQVDAGLTDGNADLGTAINSEGSENQNPWMGMMNPDLIGNSMAMPQIGQQYHVTGNAVADPSMGNYMGTDGLQADMLTSGDWNTWGPKLMEWSKQNAPQQYLQFQQGIWGEMAARNQRAEGVDPKTQQQVTQNIGTMGGQQTAPTQVPNYPTF